ncbi:hypothetical protein [Oxalicibacterium solurbis]|uniref:hypothetical protein n=1 Tax=Oxalicibacterium solurbis TaxID=69280 RepID=UPI003FCD7EE5
MAETTKKIGNPKIGNPKIGDQKIGDQKIGDQKIGDAAIKTGAAVSAGVRFRHACNEKETGDLVVARFSETQLMKIPAARGMDQLLVLVALLSGLRMLLGRTAACAAGAAGSLCLVAVAGCSAFAAGSTCFGRTEFVRIAAGMCGTAALRSDFTLLACIHVCKAAIGVLGIAWIVRHIRSPEMMVLGKSEPVRPPGNPSGRWNDHGRKIAEGELSADGIKACQKCRRGILA